MSQSEARKDLRNIGSSGKMVARQGSDSIDHGMIENEPSQSHPSCTANMLGLASVPIPLSHISTCPNRDNSVNPTVGTSLTYSIRVLQCQICRPKRDR